MSVALRVTVGQLLPQRSMKSSSAKSIRDPVVRITGQENRTMHTVVTKITEISIQKTFGSTSQAQAQISAPLPLGTVTVASLARSRHLAHQPQHSLTLIMFSRTPQMSLKEEALQQMPRTSPWRSTFQTSSSSSIMFQPHRKCTHEPHLSRSKVSLSLLPTHRRPLALLNAALRNRN